MARFAVLVFCSSSLFIVTFLTCSSFKYSYLFSLNLFCELHSNFTMHSSIIALSAFVLSLIIPTRVNPECCDQIALSGSCDDDSSSSPCWYVSTHESLILYRTLNVHYLSGVGSCSIFCCNCDDGKPTFLSAQAPSKHSSTILNSLVPI
jgi:hypothetical protein